MSTFFLRGRPSLLDQVPLLCRLMQQGRCLPAALSLHPRLQSLEPIDCTLALHTTGIVLYPMEQSWPAML